MKDEKVTAKTRDEFVRGVALDCVANMPDEGKAYICGNPFAIDYHEGYALYIRNHYIHCRDFSDADFWVEPDSLSGWIMRYIFSLLLPDEYVYGDGFVEQLFDNKEFIRLRKEYKDKYGSYPVELLRKYRDKAPETESKIDDDIDDIDAEIESLRRYCERCDVIISELISELAERVSED